MAFCRKYFDFYSQISDFMKRRSYTVMEVHRIKKFNNYRLRVRVPLIQIPTQNGKRTVLLSSELHHRTNLTADSFSNLKSIKLHTQNFEILYLKGTLFKFRRSLP
jgi:hypothetical protein